MSGISGDRVKHTVGERPFSLSGVDDPKVPILIAAPHAGRAYPADLEAEMRFPDVSKVRLEDRHVDSLAAALAVETGAPLIVAHSPRALVDLNRATDDVDWSMISGPKPERVRHSLANRRSRSGLGLVPRRLPGLGEIWRRPLDRAQLDARIEDIHRPYHAALGSALETIRDKWGLAVLLDLHSMPPLKKRFPGDDTPEFVIGDRFGASCDHRLSAVTLAWFANAGRRAAHNRPYSGGYVLDRHGAPRRNIHALQLEVCRSVYLDSKLDQPSPRLPILARSLAELVRTLAEEAVRGGNTSALRHAAE